MLDPISDRESHVADGASGVTGETLLVDSIGTAKAESDGGNGSGDEAVESMSLGRGRRKPGCEWTYQPKIPDATPEATLRLLSYSDSLCSESSRYSETFSLVGTVVYETVAIVVFVI